MAFGELVIDLGARQVVVGGRFIDLTRMEFDVLWELASRSGMVVTAEHLLRSVWRHEWVGDAHLVETLICRLRVKLGESGRHQRHIRSIRGVGYRFDPAPGMHLSAGKQAPVTRLPLPRTEAASEIIRPSAHDGCPDSSVLVHDASLILQEVLPASQSFFGWQPADVIGTFLMLTTDPSVHADRVHAIEVCRALAAMGPRLGPLRMPVRCADGSSTWACVSMVFRYGPSGEFDGIIATVHAATEPTDDANP